MGNRQAEKGEWKGSEGTMTTDNSVCRQLLCRLPACQIIISSSIYHLAEETGPYNMCKLQETKISSSYGSPKRGGPKKEKPPKMPKKKREGETEI